MLGELKNEQIEEILRILYENHELDLYDKSKEDLTEIFILVLGLTRRVDENLLKGVISGVGL